MLKKILATTVLVTFVASTALAQTETMSAPGKSLPIESESVEQGIPLLNSAPVDPSTSISLSEITVVPTSDEAVFTFSTNISTHSLIEYGLTRDYDRSISTEPQSAHTETIGELVACSTYYYRVHAEGVSTEGDFKTTCPIVKKVIKKTPAPVAKKAPPVQGVETEPVVSVVAEPVVEETLVLNAAPEESIALEATPETPALPGSMAFEDTDVAPARDANVMPVGLLLFALLSGMVVALFTFKKKKKWYQK